MTDQLLRHHCGTCHRFVSDSTVVVYFNTEDNCEIGSGTCSSCGGVEVYRALIEGPNTRKGNSKMRSEQEIKTMLTKVAKEEDSDASVEDEITALQDALSWVLYPEISDDRITPYFDM